MIDVLVIGGGAAGMSASLYALRSGKKVLILEQESFGGQIATSPKLENYPSIKAISGEEFSNNLFNQICDLGVEFDVDKVIKIEKKDDVFYVTGEFNSYEAKSVIIATGVKHRHINVEGEEELVGKGVSYCAVCDGAFYKGQDVALIGDANTALQYALLLSNYCRKVYLCMLFDRFFADDILVKALMQRDNVVITKQISLKKFIYNDELEGLLFENTQTKEEVKFDVKACFICIGQVPSNQAFANLVDLDKNGYIISDENMTTKTPGLFVAGDCRAKKIRQVATACADGAIAALMATSYIDNLK